MAAQFRGRNTPAADASKRVRIHGALPSSWLLLRSIDDIKTDRKSCTCRRAPEIDEERAYLKIPLIAEVMEELKAKSCGHLLSFGVLRDSVKQPPENPFLLQQRRCS
jgi:hypothetical protein